MIKRLRNNLTFCWICAWENW